MKRFLAVILGATVLAAAAGGWWTSAFRRGDRIAGGVSIEGVPVGGLTATEAHSRMAAEWPGARPRILRLVYGPDSWSKPAEELGIHVRLDKAIAEALAVGRRGDFVDGAIDLLSARLRGLNIEVPTETDEEKLLAALEELAREVNRPPADARVRVINGEVEIVPEKVGRKLDVDASAKAVATVAADLTRSQVELVVRTAEPSIKAADLRGFDAVLAEFSTPFDAAKEKRTHNLRLGIAKINETVVLPGQSFSLNQALGPRLASRGWQEAPTFVNGEIVDTPGGGVCQIATTVYNAALLAGLKITERHAHSRPVTYVPSGRDATVAWGGADLRFVNNLSHPILLVGWTTASRLYVRIIGAKEDKVEVELLRSNVESIPAGYKEIPDPSLPPGKKVVERKGYSGARAVLIRVIKRDGQEMKREVLHTDYYAPQAKVVRVGPAPSQKGLPTQPSVKAPLDEEPGVAPPAPDQARPTRPSRLSPRGGRANPAQGSGLIPNPTPRQGTAKPAAPR
ncbi:MAG: VanW family protein [Armatimonadetes bacterium]|nr:VanW family protein [Armatimonadota bacterium]